MRKYIILAAIAPILTSCGLASGFSGISVISLHSTQASQLSTRGEKELFEKFEYYLSRQDLQKSNDSVK